MPTRQVAPTTLEEVRDYLERCLEHARDNVAYWDYYGESYLDQRHYYGGRLDALETAIGCLRHVPPTEFNQKVKE